MLMANTMRTDENFKHFYVFDLKGSSVDRLSSNEAVVKKDLNYKEWIRKLKLSDKPLPFSGVPFSERTSLKSIIDRDV